MAARRRTADPLATRAREDQTHIDYLRAGLLEVVDELARTIPLDGAPTWWPKHQNYGFWYRRLAHETTVHRYDVQMGGAAAMVGGIPPEIALDGVDEILSLWFTHRLGVLGISDVRPGRVAYPTGDRRWIAQITPTGTSAWRADADETVDATVSATRPGCTCGCGAGGRTRTVTRTATRRCRAAVGSAPAGHALSRRRTVGGLR